MSFKVDTIHGEQAFRMPARTELVYDALCNDDDVPRRFKTEEQAARVAWRLVKDWVLVQLAFVESGMVEIDEVFLPFAQLRDGQTLYQHYLEAAPSQLLLE